MKKRRKSNVMREEMVRKLSIKGHENSRKKLCAKEKRRYEKGKKRNNKRNEGKEIVGERNTNEANERGNGKLSREEKLTLKKGAEKNEEKWQIILKKKRKLVE